MQSKIQQQLYEALLPVSELHASLVADDDTLVSVRPVPFLQHYRIYRVEYMARPMLFYVGFALRKPVYLLTAQPQNYFWLAQADGVDLVSEELALSYATTFLVVTCSPSEMFYLLSHIDDVRIRSRLTEQEVKSRDSFLKHYQAMIVPPAVSILGQSYQVTVYLIRERRLERHILLIQPDGVLEDHIEIVENDLSFITIT